MKAGTINSGKYYDGGNRYFSFNYKATATDTPGITKITWTFKSVYDGSTSGLSIYASCKLSASMEYGSLYSGSLPSYSQGQSYTSFKNGETYSGGASHTVNKSGTFYVKHNTEGKASIKIQINASIYTSSGTHNNSGTLSTEENKPYTNVTAPTSVIVSSNIVKPGDTIKISWSGAKNGTNNSITGYIVKLCKTNYYSQTGAEVVKTFEIGSTTTGVQWEIPTGVRGRKYYIEVQTKGTHNNTYFSSSPKVSFVVNSLPNEPTVTVDKEKIPSYKAQENITFTITAGTDSQSSQNISVYYSTSENGKKEKITDNTLTAIIEETTTYYFWSYDGLEYSSKPTSKTISKNEAPDFSVKTEGYVFTRNYNGETYYSLIGGIIEITNKPNATYTWYITSNNNKVKIKAGKSLKDNPWNLGIKIGEKYTLSVECNDGIETFEKNVLSGGIPATISLNTEKIYNQIEDAKNIAETNGDFYNDIRVTLPQDEFFNDNYNKLSISIHPAGSILYKPGDKDKNLPPYCEITGLRNLEAGKTYNFTVTLTAYNLTRTYTFSKQKTQQFLGGKIQEASKAEIFSNNDLTFKILAPDNFVTNVENNSKEYDFNNFNLNQNSAFQLNFIYDSKTISCSLSDNFYINSSSSDNDLYFCVKNNQLYTIAYDLGIQDSLDARAVKTVLSITNLFQETYQYETTVNFVMQRAITEQSLSAVQIGTTLLNNESTSIREGQNLSWLLQGQTYNKQDLTIEIFIDRRESKTSIENNWELYHKETKSTLNEKRGDKNAINFKFILEKTIQEISESKYIYFKAIITDYYGKKFETEPYCAGRSQRHIPPIFTISGASYKKLDKNTNEIGEIQITYTVSDDGGGIIGEPKSNLKNTITITSTDSTNFSLSESRDIKDKTITVGVTKFNSSWAPLNFSITTTLTIDDNKEYDKTTTLPIIIYNINPTIALRKNYLGINTEDFSSNKNKENAVVIISQTDDNRKLFLFQGLENTSIIDIATGQIDGFYIDGGTW